MMSDAEALAEALELTVGIAAAYVSHNSLPSSELAGLIAQIHASLTRLGRDDRQDRAEAPRPAVSARKSITNDYLVCLEDGKKFKSLKRHLRTHYDLSPEDYRRKWNLPADYPMVAPAYAKARSQLAKEMGLGQQRRRA